MSEMQPGGSMPLEPTDATVTTTTTTTAGPKGHPMVVPFVIAAVAAVLLGTTWINAAGSTPKAATVVAASGATTTIAVSTDGSVTATTEHDHGTPAVVAPVEYDPSKPVNLSGVAGVTPAEQKRAEALVTLTLKDLPHFADTKTAIAEGYKSIGDQFTGVEHYINWNYLTDGRILDPTHPESLVYDSSIPTKRTLVSAMFMLEKGQSFKDVPDIGGPLTQWHIHDNLCFSNDPQQPRVLGITSSDGSCRAPLIKFTPVPMIHVWIVKNKCGPFAALEGVGAGQTEDGSERACDHVHGGS